MDPSLVQDVVRRLAHARGGGGESDAAHVLFEQLVAGEARVVDRFEAGDRRYLVAIENPPDVVASYALAPRERQIYRLVATGRPVKCIAFDLGLLPATAAGYVLSACRKTGLRSRSELLQWFSRCAA